MSEKDYAPLSIACVRGLCDKLYEKRKFAGAEIEKMVREFSEAGNCAQVARLIRVLGTELMASSNPNVKNGALMGLSSAAVGLGKGVEPHALALLTPIVAAFSESESRVRYQAAEALFNVLKVCRGCALSQLALVFEAVARLVADPEPQVRQAAELVDRLLKDIVTESSAPAPGALEPAAVVRLVRERAYARAAPQRQWAAGWVAALDAAPHLSLAPHLPDLADPLFRMLDDASPEIRRMAEVQLSEFLRAACAEGATCDLAALINIACTHGAASAPSLQLPALRWLRALGQRCPAALTARAAAALHAVLPCLAYDDPNPPKRDIREAAVGVNHLLTSLLTEGRGAGRGEGEGEGEVDVGAVVEVLVRHVTGGAVPAQEAALQWVLALGAEDSPHRTALRDHSAAVFGAALHGVGHAHAGVLRRCLGVLGALCAAEDDPHASEHYARLLQALLRMFAQDEALLEDRGAFIVRQLCVLLGAERVYVSLARCVRSLEGGGGGGGGGGRLQARVVALLADSLLTAAELHALRQQLRAQRDSPLFRELYVCWCHSPVALLALCLLTHNYQHCNQLIATFGELEITVEFLTEVDKLVQLIESPVFAYLRLELLRGDSAAGALRAALCGLLMLLPQGDAFHTLRRRLQCAPPAPAPAMAPADPALDELLQEFVRVQAAQRDQRLLAHTDT